MLRKRTRSVQKDQQMGHLAMSDPGSESHFQSDFLGHSHKTSSISGLFVGLSSKGSDCDSVRSPTSPLDFRVFSNLASSSKSPRSSQNGQQRSWDCNKVGLSIVDSLDVDMKGPGVLGSSESKNILFAPQVRIKSPTFQTYTNSFEAPKSLPRNFAIFPRTYTKSPLHKDSSDVLFEIGEAPFEPETFGQIRSCSLDSCKTISTLSPFADLKSKERSISGNFQLGNLTTQVNSPLHHLGGSPNSNKCSPKNFTLLTSMSVSSSNGFIGGLSASEIELSEDYTCVISHGPNPKKTHIYGDCILECPFDDLHEVVENQWNEVKLPQAVTSSMVPSGYLTNDFLSFCYYCHKKLEEGKDIYIYRGEKAFCSLNCRSQEIMIDEELDETIDTTPEEYPDAENGKNLINSGLFYAQ